jgi:hypothetical protein
MLRLPPLCGIATTIHPVSDHSYRETTEVESVLL